MKKLIYICSFTIFMMACDDTSDDLGNLENGGNQDPPTGVLLIFPYEDALCNEGEDPTPTESTVYFEWEPNDNAESYTLTLENLDTGATSEYSTSDFILPITIQRAMAFRWFVTYSLQGEIKKSAVWNFYNAGPGIQNYAPFPAEIIAPTMAQNIAATTSVTLQWSGSDVDNDIVNYDVYFGTENPPNLNTSGITAEQLTVSVTTGTIYYWKVMSNDSAGNSSGSSVHEFRVLQ